MSSPRVRRSPPEARRLILEAAEQLLVEGGPSAVQIRNLASRIGVTDAAVYHHFGNREGLLGALLKHGGRKLRSAVDDLVKNWSDDRDALSALVDLLAQLHASGFAALALALHQAGYRDRGSGILNPVVEVLHTRRKLAAAERQWPPPSKDDTRLAVAQLHQAMFADALFGDAFRRSAGMTRLRGASTRFWWGRTLATVLGVNPRIRNH